MPYFKKPLHSPEPWSLQANQVDPVQRTSLQWRPLAGFGCYVALDDQGNLMSVNALADGSSDPRPDTFCELVNVDDNQEFVDAINQALGTAYKLSDFPGR